MTTACKIWQGRGCVTSGRERGKGRDRRGRSYPSSAPAGIRMSSLCRAPPRAGIKSFPNLRPAEQSRVFSLVSPSQCIPTQPCTLHPGPRPEAMQFVQIKQYTVCATAESPSVSRNKSRSRGGEELLRRCVSLPKPRPSFNLWVTNMSKYPSPLSKENQGMGP